MSKTGICLTNLSKQAKSLWAKSDYGEDVSWLPLYIHMSDTCCIAEKLWEEWLPRSTKGVIARVVDDEFDMARKLVCFLAATHDLGKATPLFQARPLRFAIGEISENLAWKPRKAGLPIRGDLAKRSSPSHPIAGQAIMERYLAEKGWKPSERHRLSSVIGAHHGKPPQLRDLKIARKEKLTEMGWAEKDEERWWSVQVELVEFAKGLAGVDESVLACFRAADLFAPVESLLCGLVIMADWIASNTDLFPLHPIIGQNGQSITSLQSIEERANRAWRHLSLTSPWVGVAKREECVEQNFAIRFDLPVGAKPRPVQRAAIDVALSVDCPGIMVVEAPMGEGKTEAALAAAEILAARSGCGGVCIALPTMATTDAMFGRVAKWLRHLPKEDNADNKSIYLAHGKSQLNEEFQGLIAASRSGWSNDKSSSIACEEGVSDVATVSEWMFGRKKGMLANFVVCTVDQVLMGALEMKHLPLRQLALANKVVVIDECHAYDAYMQNYLARILEWLGAWRVPVVLLSATLPEKIRRRLVSAYRGVPESLENCSVTNEENLNQCPENVSSLSICPPRGASLPEEIEGKYPYPIITYTNGCQTEVCEIGTSGETTEVSLNLISDDDESLAALLEQEMVEGGCVGVLCSTVPRAQHMARILSDRFGQNRIVLSHARFIDLDRMENEKALREKLGPHSTISNGKRPDSLIVVGTQVLEQSLDIDFDFMVSDVAPVDLILQRLGRLHRHRRGEGESERPKRLRHARCYLRGIASFESGIPHFASGINAVYDEATLMEALGVLGLFREDATSCITLPTDIAPLVQVAYGDNAAHIIPSFWGDSYDIAVKKRRELQERKSKRAQGCLLKSARGLNSDGASLMDLFGACIDDSNSKLGVDKGQCAVRDTQETIEVMLAIRRDTEVRLLPWIGDPGHGMEHGCRIPIDSVPDDGIAKLLAQSSVRLPLQMCRNEDIDDLIDELEKRCGPYVGAWQDSFWLAGRLALLLEEEEGTFSATVHGWRVNYSRNHGISII